MKTEIKHIEISKLVLKYFGVARVVCVVTYGSSIDEVGKKPADIDIFILLKKFDIMDFTVGSVLKKRLPSVSIFVDYEDSIIKKGINNYQFGRHGVYFIKILENGICLYGKNKYIQWSKLVTNKKIKLDLRYRIDEYFYRIYREITDRADLDVIRKYLCRIIIDILLYENKITFPEVSQVHYLRLIQNYLTYNKDIREDLFTSIINIKYKNSDHYLSSLINELYKIYLKIYN